MKFIGIPYYIHSTFIFIPHFALISLRFWVAHLFTSCFTRWATVDAIYSGSGWYCHSIAALDLIFRDSTLQHWVHVVYLILVLLSYGHMNVDYCVAERRA